MQANVSLDKVILDYVQVPKDFLEVMQQQVKTLNVKMNEGIHYRQHMQIRREQAYINIFYQSKYDLGNSCETLRLETHPKHLKEFKSLLHQLKNVSNEIHFVSTDVAYDIPYSITNVFVTSNTGRQMNIFQGTKYFGGKDQRRRHGYCRIYDKRQELLKNGILDSSEELTRIEMVYKPTKKSSLRDFLSTPPVFNNLYTGRIIQTMQEIAPHYKAILICLQNGDMTINEFSSHYRRVIKNLLINQTPINFDEIIKERWVNELSHITSLVL